MKIVYLDESGTIGTKAKEPYFVITAVIFDNEQALRRAKNIIKRTKARVKMPVELKASRLNTAQKQRTLNALTSKADYRVGYIVVEKAKLSQKLYAHKNVTYNYLFGILMKRILQKSSEDVRIITDSRTTKVTSADSLCDYIRAKAYGDWGFGYDIAIDQAESHTHLGLQVADLVSNTIFARYNFNAEHLYALHQQHFIIRERFPYSDFELAGTTN